jgi:UDP-glucose 4-epimerase
VILGHDGFIGRHLGEPFRLAWPGVDPVGFSLPGTDLTDPAQVEGILRHLGEETILVFAAGIKKQHGDSLEVFGRNLAMAVNVCRLLERRPVRRVVFFSTAEVYGEDVHNLAIDEETPVRPVSYYGAAKFASECILQRTVAARAGSSCLILRFPFVYGPGDSPGIYGPLGFLARGLAGEPVVLWGDGGEQREFLWVGDLARAVVRLAQGTSSGVVNVVSGKSHTFREVAELVNGMLPSPVAIGERPRTKGRVDNAYTGRRFRELVPDFRFTPLEEGLRILRGTLRTEGGVSP